PSSALILDMHDRRAPIISGRLLAGAALLFSLVWIYAGTIIGLVTEWVSSPDASYGIVLAGVAFVVLWRRRQALSEAFDPVSPFRPGLSVLVSGLLLYLAGVLGADLFVTRVSLVIVLTGTMWFLTGPRSVRLAAAPLIFFLMAV